MGVNQRRQRWIEQVQLRCRREFLNITFRKQRWWRLIKTAVVQTQQQVNQNMEVYSPKSENKDAREVQKKLTVFFPDSLQEASTDILGTGIELSY